METTLTSFGYAGGLVFYLADDTIVTNYGNTLKFYRPDGTIKHVLGQGKGISCMTVNSSRDVIAYAEGGPTARIFLLSYPSLQLRTLTSSATLPCQALSFSRGGDHLAAISQHPENAVQHWNLQTNISESVTVPVKEVPAVPWTLAWEPAGPSLLVGGGGLWLIRWAAVPALPTPPPLGLSHATIVAMTTAPEGCWVLSRPTPSQSSVVPPPPFRSQPSQGEGEELELWKRGTVSGLWSVGGEWTAVGTVGPWVVLGGPTSIQWRDRGNPGTEVQRMEIPPLFALPMGTVARLSVGGSSLSYARGTELWTLGGPPPTLPKVKAVGIPGMETMATVGRDWGVVGGVGVGESSVSVWGVGGCLALRLFPGTTLTALTTSHNLPRIFFGTSQGWVRLLALTPQNVGPSVGPSADPRVWEAAEWEGGWVLRTLHRWRVSRGAVTSVTVAPDNQLVAVGTAQGRVLLLQCHPPWEVVGVIPFPGGVASLSWTGGSVVVALSKESPGPGEVFRVDPPTALPTALPKDRLLSNGAVQKAVVKVQSPVTMVMAEPRTVGKKMHWWALTRDPGVKRYVFPEHPTDSALLSDVDVSTPKGTFPGHRLPPSGLSVRGEWVCSGGGDGRLLLRSLAAPLTFSLLPGPLPRDSPSFAPKSLLAPTGVRSVALSEEAVWSVGGTLLFRHPLPSSSSPPLESVAMETAAPQEELTDLPDLPDRELEDEPPFGEEAEPELPREPSKELVEEVAKLRERVSQLIPKAEEVGLRGAQRVVDRELLQRLREEAEAQVREEERAWEAQLSHWDHLSQAIERHCWAPLDPPAKVLWPIRAPKGAQHADSPPTLGGLHNPSQGVPNFPLPRETAAERLRVQRVLSLRRVEFLVHRSLPPLPRGPGLLHHSLRGAALGVGHHDNGEGREGEGEVVEGLLFHPADLAPPLRQRVQSCLLQTVARHVMQSFNRHWDSHVTLKHQELLRFRQRGERLQEIGKELGVSLDLPPPFSPLSESPERLLEAVHEHFTPPPPSQPSSQTQGEEVPARAQGEEEERRDARERGLWAMLGSGNSLREWGGPQEEAETRRKGVENDLKSLQALHHETAAHWDDLLHALGTARDRAEQRVREVEAARVRLLQRAETQRAAQAHLSLLLRRLATVQQRKAAAVTALSHFRAIVEGRRREYETAVGEEKRMDREVKKTFERDYEEFAELLFRLYKKRPKPSPPEDSTSESANPTNLSSNLSDKPEVIDEVTWQRVVQLRQVGTLVTDLQEKMQKEKELKKLGNELNELTTHENALVAQDLELGEQFEALLKEWREFHDRQLLESANLDLHMTLKQGQIEVDQAAVVTDYSDSVLIDKSVVERLNDRIRTLGTEKVRKMKEIKEKKKVIEKKKWENKRLDMIAEDLHEKTKYFQLMRVTKHLQGLIRGGEEDLRSVEVEALEKRIAHSAQAHSDKVAEKTKLLNKLRGVVESKRRENQELSAELEALQAAVEEREQLHSIQQMGKEHVGSADERMKKTMQQKKLHDLYLHQQQELEELKSTLSKQYERTLPFFKA